MSWWQVLVLLAALAGLAATIRFVAWERDRIARRDAELRRYLGGR